MRLTAALLIAAAAFLPAKAAVVTAPDSVQQAVATFIAENFKLGMAQAIDDLRAQGLGIDSARVARLVMENWATPYSNAVHTEAYNKVSRELAETRTVVNEAFMAEAKSRPGATVLPDGLVFQTMSQGNGPHPTAESVVKLRYRGVLPDGTVFDEITPDDEPMTGRASDFVPGFTEGLLMMQAGGNYILTIPAALAYGPTGAGGVIPPDTPLRFDIELVDILN